MQNLITKNDICCIIITFNPDHSLLTLIDIIESQVDKIIIVDNFSEEEKFKIISNCSQYGRMRIIRNDENFGIAKALNQGMGLAKQLGFNWVITFDQDTQPSSNIIDIISEVYFLYPAKDKIGAIGVNAVDANNNIYYKVPEKANFLIKDYLITSGCLISTNIFFEIGGFREDFFIDNVDIEYSLRLKKHEKISLISEKCGMIHKAGNSISKQIMGLNMESSNHNSDRRYYMSRNHIIISKEYFLKFPYFISKLNYFFFLALVKILLIEDEKKNKIVASFKGIKDGLLYPSSKKKLST